MSWIVTRLRWVLIAAMIGGPVLAYFSYSELQRFKKLDAEGVTTEAVVTGGQEKTGRRGSKSFEIDIEWQDASGQIRREEGISITSDYARTIVTGDTLNVDTVPITYMENDASVKPAIKNNVGEKRETDALMVKLGAAAGGIGLIGTLMMFMMGRKKKPVVDAPYRSE